MSNTQSPAVAKDQTGMVLGDASPPVDKVNKSALTRPKEQAVELWRTTRGHITNICSALSISRTTFYNWLEDDAEFAQALADAEAELNDDVRDALVQKIADGDTPAIRYYLDRRHPDFKPQRQVPGPMTQNNFYFTDEQLERIIQD